MPAVRAVREDCETVYGSSLHVSRIFNIDIPFRFKCHSYQSVHVKHEFLQYICRNALSHVSMYNTPDGFNVILTFILFGLRSENSNNDLCIFVGNFLIAIC